MIYDQSCHFALIWISSPVQLLTISPNGCFGPCFPQVDAPAEKKVEPEPSFEILTNPARVVPAQEKVIKFLEESRYSPVKSASSGFVLLKDLRPTEPEVLALTDAPSSTGSAPGGSTTGQQGSASSMAVDEEPQPPQPFEYTS